MIASGSEVSLALQAAKTLEAEGRLIRVVSMPCQEWFALQPASFQRSVLPEGVPRMVVEAASSFGWERYGGAGGVYVTVDGFGASAPAERLFEHVGLTAENLTAQLRKTLAKR